MAAVGLIRTESIRCGHIREVTSYTVRRRTAPQGRSRRGRNKRGPDRSGVAVARRHQTLDVALLAAAGTEILDLLGPYQVFMTAVELHARAQPRSPPIYRVEIVAATRSKTIETNCNLSLMAHRTVREAGRPIDTLLIAGGSAIETDRTDSETVNWVRRAARSARRVGSVCTGALLLARAGLLDGRHATTHWNWCERLSRRFPRVQVNPDPIYVRDGNVYTSAGVTAGMDLALALIEEDHGSKLALEVARQLVLYLRRPGSQSQFSAALASQVSDRHPLQELQAWVLEHLDQPLNVRELAAQAAMSPRNFARVFALEVGMTPGKFVKRLRVETARRRLEETRLNLETVAREVGFGSVISMHRAFQRVLGIAPHSYRQHFRAAAPSEQDPAGARADSTR